MNHRYGTKSMGLHGRPNCLLMDWPTSWMISFKHWAWEVCAYFLQSNFLSENSTMDFLKTTANTSQVISSRTFFVCTECVVVLQFH